MYRRQFLKTMGVGAAGVLFGPAQLFAGRLSSASFFGLHPFIEAHPEAVFIKKTNVAVKTDSEGMKNEGLALAQEIFVPKEEGGIPLTYRIPIKPNLTCSSNSRRTVESGMGIVTDPYFVEGVIEGMKELGLSSDRFSLIEYNCSGDWSMRGYTQMATRTGATLKDYARPARDLTEGEDITWVDKPDGVMFKRIAYIAPVNQPDTWLLNIAKFKAHGMGLTLCCKNQQGMCGQHYVNFCASVGGIKKYPSYVLKDFQPNFDAHVRDLYAQHVEAEIPRWDRPGGTGGFWMETWAQRTCDSLSATDTGFCIIEGVYGRDGNGFHEGPGHGGIAQDYMTNVLIFGKDKFRADIIGHWLGGHEPGNFGLFHIAKERGLSDVLNPKAIPVYLWEESGPTLTPLEEFERYPLPTYYLQRDYGGQNEPKYHLVDEPYDYGPLPTAVETSREEAAPDAYVLGQNYPNPFNASTVIEYRMPRNGHARLEVYNESGQLVDLLVDAWRSKGRHMASWNSGERATGTYLYRFVADGFQRTRKMTLVR